MTSSGQRTSAKAEGSRIKGGESERPISVCEQILSRKYFPLTLIAFTNAGVCSEYHLCLLGQELFRAHRVRIRPDALAIAPVVHNKSVAHRLQAMPSLRGMRQHTASRQPSVCLSLSRTLSFSLSLYELLPASATEW